MHWKGKDMQDVWSYMENSCFWQLCSQGSNRGTQSEKSGPKYWKDIKKPVMGSLGNCFRKGKSLSSAETVYILPPIDKIAAVFWAVTLQLQSRARSLAHTKEKEVIHESKNYFFASICLALFKKYHTASYPTSCLLQALSRKDLITKRLEIPLFLIFLKKFLFALLSFVLQVKKNCSPKQNSLLWQYPNSITSLEFN